MSVDKGAIASTRSDVTGRCTMETTNDVNELAIATRAWFDVVFMAELPDSV